MSLVAAVVMSILPLILFVILRLESALTVLITLRDSTVIFVLLVITEIVVVHVKVQNAFFTKQHYIIFYILSISACNCTINGVLSEICDNITGECLCNDANAVADCSECLPGFYGSPADVTCTQCPCPVANNSHASSCQVESDILTCDCDEKYAGSSCQKCNDGYYGDPLVCWIYSVLLNDHC